MVADVTARKRAEEALREGEARERARTKELEAILDALPVPVLIAYDTECKRMKGNRRRASNCMPRADQNFSQSAGRTNVLYFGKCKMGWRLQRICYQCSRRRPPENRYTNAC
jgi:hypothetical protein